MGKQSMLYGIIGVLLGGLLVGATATMAVNSNNNTLMRSMGMNANSDNDMMDMDHGSSSSHMGMTMDNMATALKGKTGDKFDEAFIAEMIDHHQGAIDMANLAKTNAKHNEIKALADDIIAAQTKEITQMKQWRQDWGY